MMRYRVRSILAGCWFICQCISMVSSREKTRCPLQVPSSIENRPSKTIIAHRGASFSLPEHTLEAYRLALDLGADYIEPDLVSTKDGKLIAVHTLDLNITTNVDEVYPGRTTFSEHVNRTGYWAYDFTLEEIQLLRVKQRLGDTGARSVSYDGMFQIPTLQEILELLQHYNRDVIPLLTSAKKRVGVYAELKYPEWLERDANLSLVDLFLDELSEYLSPTDMIWNDTECASLKFDEYLIPPLVMQSFDGTVLKDLKKKWTRFNNSPQIPPMVLLVNSENCWRDDFWFNVGEWSSFLAGIGPEKMCLVGEESRPFMNRAKEHQLAVHPWTVRGELEFGLLNYTSIQQELQHWFCDLQVDGIFSENVDVAVRVASMPCPSQEATPVPTTVGAAKNQLCYNTDNEAQLYVGVAAGVMGIFIGSIFSFWLANSGFCRSRRHSRRQLAIPTQDPVDVEVV